MLQEMGATRVLVWPSEGSLIASEQDGADLVGESLSARARLVAVPVTRLTPAFLDLRSGLAGAVLQKFVNYRIRLAIVGDISAAVARSPALADFVRESNRGSHIWFVEDLASLQRRLGE